MFTYDAINERENNNKNNINLVFKQFKNIKSFKQLQSYNKKSLERYLKYHPNNLSEDSLLKICKENEGYAYTVSCVICINASRQGCIEEKKIINGIGEFLKDKITVEAIPTRGKQALRPLRSGGVINAADTEKKLKNSDVYLKTIDGLIKSRYDEKQILGYIFAKVVVGIGGHQDNVEKEADDFINWATNEPKEKLYVVLVDGDEDKKNNLLRKQKDNIWIVNHVEFQERLIKYAEADTRTILHNNKSI